MVDGRERGLREREGEGERPLEIRMNVGVSLRQSRQREEGGVCSKAIRVEGARKQHMDSALQDGRGNVTSSPEDSVRSSLSQRPRINHWMPTRPPIEQVVSLGSVSVTTKQGSANTVNN